MTYIYQRPEWPNLQGDLKRLARSLAEIRHRQGRLIGRMEGLGFELRTEAVLRALTEDVVKSSEIEGESLDREQVRSSIARRLGIDIGALAPADRHVDGVVEMMLDATQAYDRPLTKERLYAWHAALFPTGRSGMAKITVGAWRDTAAGPMRVVSGPIGKERVHFEAPPADRLEQEMTDFLSWFEGRDDLDPVLKAALAHLWFVTVHPFDDGNGRIARAIADMALARAEESAQRFYSMSAQILETRKDYYDILEATQKGSVDVTPWLEWFLTCLARAIDGAEVLLATVIRKAQFWDHHRDEDLNARQRLVLNQLLDGFDGKLTSSKYGKLTKTSQDTALRDINDLERRGLLVREAAGGRSTSYALGDE
ncbi:MAG: Fic family protein [Devosia sp.]